MDATLPWELIEQLSLTWPILPHWLWRFSLTTACHSPPTHTFEIMGLLRSIESTIILLASVNHCELLVIASRKEIALFSVGIQWSWTSFSRMTESSEIEFWITSVSGFKLIISMVSVVLMSLSSIKTPEDLTPCGWRLTFYYFKEVKEKGFLERIYLERESMLTLS